MIKTRALELLSKITDAMAVLLKYCGIDEQQVHDAVAKSYASVQIPAVEKSTAPPLPLAHRNLLGRMLSYWRNEATFVDEQGEPLPLPVHGDGPSIATLFERAARNDPSDLSGINSDKAAELLASHDSVATNEDGLLFPISLSFKINVDTTAGALSNLAYLAEMAGTTSHNAYLGQGGLFHAVARAQGLPAELLPLVTAMLNGQGYKFLAAVDAFIESKKDAFIESKKGTNSQTYNLRNIGVGMYLINEPHEPE